MIHLIVGACYLVKAYTTVKIVELPPDGVMLVYEGYKDEVYWNRQELLNRIEKQVNCPNTL